MKLCWRIVGAALLLVAPRLVAAQDVTGNYVLTVLLPGVCEWQGELALVQSGTSVSGTGSLSLQPGSNPGCAPTLSGSVSGTIVGSTITLGFASSGLGTVNFTGTVGANSQTLSGTWSVAAGPSGTWLAVRHAASAPAVHGVALILLALLLMVGGATRRRRER